MNFIEWKHRYAIGIPFIDAQHKRLFVITNNIYAARAPDKRRAPVVKYSPRQGIKYFERHILMEEQIMLFTAYPRLEEHRKEHAEFNEIILNALEKEDPGQDHVIRNWIFSHITKDIALGRYLLDLKKSGNLAILSMAAAFSISFNPTKGYTAGWSL
jgi:hemerythrin-like metal-binding protein